MKSKQEKSSKINLIPLYFFVLKYKEKFIFISFFKSYLNQYFFILAKGHLKDDKKSEMMYYKIIKEL